MCRSRPSAEQQACGSEDDHESLHTRDVRARVNQQPLRAPSLPGRAAHASSFEFRFSMFCLRVLLLCCSPFSFGSTSVSRHDVRTCAGGHVNLAAAATHNPGFQTVILPGSPGYALYPSARVPQRGLPHHASDLGGARTVQVVGEACSTASTESVAGVQRAPHTETYRAEW